MKNMDMVGESLIGVLDRLGQDAADVDIDRVLRLLALQPSTAVVAFLERAQRAMRAGRPQVAFLSFLNAYRHQPDDDARLLYWMTRAARAQRADQQADVLERLASQIQARQAPDVSEWLAEARQECPLTDPCRQASLGDHHARPLELDTAHPKCGDPGDSTLEDALPRKAARPEQPPVEIIIPVYRGEAETLACLRSVIAARPLNQTPHHLRVLNDASPEPQLVLALERLAQQTDEMTLVHHQVNLGFIRGVNRAMQCCPDRDVVWLNADTRVCGDWLDRLRTWAYCQPKVASVTPFSNHGELLTFPEPRYRYPMPAATEQAQLDRAARAANADQEPIAIPVGCGFCLYLRRDAIAEVGYLDEYRLAGGYGEDTEWCLRAAARGWRHLAAPDVFVAHQGSVSFGADKAHRVARNNAIIRALYPGAECAYEQFVARDPLAHARQALQAARLAALIDWAREAIGPEPPLGSTQVHPRHLHLLGPAGIAEPASPFFAERPASVTADRAAPAGLLWLNAQCSSRGHAICLHAAIGTSPVEMRYSVPDELGRLSADLQQVPLIGVIDHHPGRQPQCLIDLVHQIKRPLVALKRPLVALEPCPSPIGADSQTITDQVWIIADTLYDPRLQRAWTRIARAFARQPSAPKLLVLEDNGRPPELMATGQLLELPELPGLGLSDLATLSGCAAVVTLETNIEAQAVAFALAERLQLRAYCLDMAALPPALPQPEVGRATLPSKAYQSEANETSPAMTAATVPLESASPSDDERPAFLNIGCGRTDASRLPSLFRHGHWREIRLDVDPAVQADIIASSVDLSELEDASFGAAYSSHTIEHLEPHEVPVALKEIYRILKPDGFALLTLPDLEAVAQLVVEGKLTETAYESPVGPITALDMLFGHRPSLANGNHYMAHRTGFDTRRLGEALLEAGFEEVRIRKGRCYDLWAYAFKQKLQDDPPWLAFPLAATASAT